MAIGSDKPSLTRDTLRQFERHGYSDVEIADICGVTRQAVHEARKRWKLPKIYAHPKVLVPLTLPAALIRKLDGAVEAASLKPHRSRSGYVGAVLHEHF